MERKEPKFRIGGNWEELANLFNYTIGKYDQDWTYTIAEPERLKDYINAYHKFVSNEDSKFSLMEMILQALNDQKDTTLIDEKWAEVKDILDKNFKLHEYTIFYWCCWETEDIKDCWLITPLLRKLWLSKTRPNTQNPN